MYRIVISLLTLMSISSIASAFADYKCVTAQNARAILRLDNHNTHLRVRFMDPALAPKAPSMNITYDFAKILVSERPALDESKSTTDKSGQFKIVVKSELNPKDSTAKPKLNIDLIETESQTIKTSFHSCEL